MFVFEGSFGKLLAHLGAKGPRKKDGPLGAMLEHFLATREHSKTKLPFYREHSFCGWRDPEKPHLDHFWNMFSGMRFGTHLQDFH